MVVRKLLLNVVTVMSELTRLSDTDISIHESSPLVIFMAYLITNQQDY